MAQEQTDAQLAAAVLGGSNIEETMAVEKILKEAVVEHKTYDDLTDVVSEQGLDLENYTYQIIEAANTSNDEQWRMQWDAVLSLRILNKFHFQVLEGILDQFTTFIKGQIENLRSNNSRNALALFLEIFSNNAEKCPEGRKDNDTWALFLDVNLAPVFAKTAADKKFLSLAAQQGVLAVAEVSPVPQTSAVLIKNSNSKNMQLAELGVRSLEILIKSATPWLLVEPHHEEQFLTIVHCLAEVLAQKQMKKVKFAKPAMQHIQKVIGGAYQLKALCLKAYKFVSEQEKANKMDETEECKESSEQAEAAQVKLVKQIDQVVASLTAKKAAPKAGFRTFMKTQKTELKEMNLAVQPAALAQAAAPESNPFMQSVALPKGQSLLPSDTQSATTTQTPAFISVDSKEPAVPNSQ